MKKSLTNDIAEITALKLSRVVLFLNTETKGIGISTVSGCATTKL